MATTSAKLDISNNSAVLAKRGMPLRRMLILSVGALLVMLLLGNSVLNIISARHYLQSQLQTHAEDAVTALGMSLSSALSAGDEVTAGLVIDAIYDRGYYEHVILWNAKKEPWIVRYGRDMPDTVPAWFSELMHLQGRQAVSDVSSGWKMLGSVSVKVHPGLMYEKLWETMKVEAAWFGFVLLLSLGALLVVISRTTGPIRALADMASTIGQGDFSVRVAPTGARELQVLALAMGDMASRIDRMNALQVEQIESLRLRLQIDVVTGALNRDEFDRKLQAFLDTREGVGHGQLILLQVNDFAEFNNQNGRAAGDQFLEKIYLQIKSRAKKIECFFAGRRTGADFVCFLPGADISEADRITESIVRGVSGLREVRQWCRSDLVHAGVTTVAHTESVADVLANADIALRNAQAAVNNGWQRFQDESHSLPLDTMHKANEWRETLLAAIQDEAVIVHYQPIFAAEDKHVVYSKALSRLSFNGDLVTAGVFMPMAERFELARQIDKAVITQVIRYLDEKLHYGARIGVSVSSEALQDEAFLTWLQDIVHKYPAAAHCLFLEISEFLLQRDLSVASNIMGLAAQTGFTVVIDHFGQSTLPFSYLQSLPLKWIKIDRDLVHGIEDRADSRFYLQSITTIAHSQGVKVIAFGIESETEWVLLQALGVDAGAGYGLQKPKADINAIDGV